MSTQVPHPIVVNYFFLFTLRCDPVTKDASCLSTIDNDGSTYSVSKNSILRETGSASTTESFDVSMLDSGFSDDKSMTGSNFGVSIDNDGSIK